MLEEERTLQQQLMTLEADNERDRRLELELLLHDATQREQAEFANKLHHTKHSIHAKERERHRQWRRDVEKMLSAEEKQLTQR